MDRSKRTSAARALYNKNGFWCGFWIVVQQIMVALSTVLIVWLMKELAQYQRLSLIYLTLFVSSLIGVYVPIALSHVYLEKFKFTSFRTYIDTFIGRNKLRRTLAHKRVKSEYESWVTNESYLVYEEATGLLYDVFATFLNAAVSIVAISSMLDQRLILGYMGAFVILYFSNRIFRRTIERSSSAVQDARKTMGQALLAIWDNVFIGNRHNLGIWRELFGESMANFEVQTVTYTARQAIVSSGTVACVLAAVGYGVFVYIQDNWRDTGALSALVVTFPRQIQIIQSIFAFFRHMMAWEGTKARLQGLEKPLELEDENSASYIHWDRLEFCHQGRFLRFSGMNELRKFLQDRSNIRLTIRGANGAGKSTLLAVLATELGEDAFYLPTRSDLLFKNRGLSDASDGQSIKVILDELQQDITMPATLILDEWDANLDQTNMHTLNQQIEKLSAKWRVIEVRHRRPTTEKLETMPQERKGTGLS